MRGNLKNLTVKNLGAGRYSDGGGLGLILSVTPGGSRSWLQRITINGKRREMGLGPWPIVSLAEAREMAFENARAVHSGRNPLAEKQASKRKLAFVEVAERMWQEQSFTTEKERLAFWGLMKKHVLPAIGALDVAAVSSAEVRQMVLAIRKRTPAQAVKVQQKTYAVFRWSVAEGLRPDNPASSAALALPKVKSTSNHYRALPYSELSDALALVDRSGAWLGSKLCMRWIALTACRSGEARGATWDEIDGDLWTIPASRMKMNREHIVPLPPQALAVLEQAQAISDRSGLLFPSLRGKVMSDMTLGKLLRTNGIDSTIHGFRTSFRTWTQEQTNVAGEVGEAALAHSKKDRSEAAYARSTLLNKRRDLMRRWADYLEKL